MARSKRRRARQVPLPDQAAIALERLSRRGEFTAPDDYVFASRLGRRLDPSALRRRFERARDAAGIEPLRFHDLRHTYGSLLVAGGVDLPSVKAAMGHSHITTTERYLHARPAGSWRIASPARLLGLRPPRELSVDPARKGPRRP
ncbi:MAG: tyrosine-type recombinase/integrase [Solirubrobacteraceae bacterium]